MLDDELNDNPLFSLFLSSPHYAVAASQCLTVVVPPASSLQHLSPRLSSSTVDSHVLRVSPYFVGQYLTANGRSVGLVDGRSLHCLSGGGWLREDEGRISRIVESETYYDDDLASFTVLRVDMPLEGRVSADYERAVRSEGAGGSLMRLLPRRTLHEHETVLKRVTGDDSVLLAIQRFVHQFNSSYVLVRGFLDHAGQKVADACSRLSQSAASRSKEGSNNGGNRRQLAAEVSAAVECAVLSGVHTKLFAGLVELHAAEELRLQAAITRMRRLSMAALGIRDDIRCQPIAACQLLAALGTYNTPLQKMAQLEEVNRAITQAVREQTDSHTNATPAVAQHREDVGERNQHDSSAAGTESADGTNGPSGDVSAAFESVASEPPRKRDLVLSAEDMIPLTVYVVVHSRLQHIAAHMAHLQYFPPAAASECVDQLAVHWVNFQAACQLVQAGKVSSFDRSEEEEGKEAVHPMHASTSTSASLLTVSSDGVEGLTAGSSAVHAARRHHSRSVSSSTLSSLHSSVRRSPSSSPTPTFHRSSSLPTAEDGTLTASRPPDLSRPATSVSLCSTVSPLARPGSSSSTSSDSARRPARPQRRHATLPAQQGRSPANNTAQLLPPHSHTQHPHSQSQPRAMAGGAAAASDDDRLGHFLSRLKRSDDVVTGNISSNK